MIVPSQKTPPLTPQFRPQDEHSVPQGFGSYGLYRLLLRSQHPQLHPTNPLAAQLMPSLARAVGAAPRLSGDYAY